MGRKVELERGRVIIVMGVSGSGKSTLGSLLAEGLGCRFVEGDRFHSQANVAKMRNGEPLTDADRWPWLDDLGAAIAASANTGETVIAACSALRRVYRDRLRAAIGEPLSFVLLEARHEELVRRLDGRPGHYMPASLLHSQLATLEQPAAEENALKLDASCPPAMLAADALDWLGISQKDRAQRIA